MSSPSGLDLGLDPYPEVDGFQVGDGDAAKRLAECVLALRAGASNLNAVVAVDLKRAFAECARLDEMARAGHICGTLHGMPMVVKDNIDVAGLPTTNGSAIHCGQPATEDAEVVKRLRSAGAVIFGKTNMDELALGVTSSNGRYPRTLHAWRPDRIPGGSSGGSAVALASGVAEAALGTDTAGSARTPAAFNGIVGLRPTIGALSTNGVVPLSTLFDTVGPMARNVETVRQLFAAMAKPASLRASTRLDRYPRFDAPAPLTGLRIGIFERYFFEGASPDVAAVVRAALDVLSDLGAVPVEVFIPGVETTQRQLSKIMLRDAYQTYRNLIDVEESRVHPIVLERVSVGREVTDAEYAAALDDRKQWTNRVRHMFRSVDLIMVPTTPVVAPRLAAAENALGAVQNVTQFTFPWSLAGVPALSVPCGLSSDLPVGMQLVGPHGSDLPLMHIATLYEHQTLWNQRFENVKKTIDNAADSR